MSLLPPTFNESLFDTIDGAESSVRRNFTPFIQELDCTLTTGQKRLGESDGVIMTLLNK